MKLTYINVDLSKLSFSPADTHMRKEILFATIAGIIFGVVIAFGIWRVDSALKTEDAGKSPSETTDNQNHVPGPEKELKITLASPEDNDVITKNPAKISGITKSESWVVISTEDDDHVLKTDESGVFEQDVNLAGGANQILVYAFDETGSVTKKDLVVVFSSEFEKQLEND